MNEPTSIVPPVAIPPTPTYKDRSAGLVVFGVFTILLGVLCGLMVPLMLLGQVMSAQHSNAPAPPQAMLLPGLMYAGLAVALVWLGIGSIKARRWARALLLIFSWSCLVMGVTMVPVMAVLLPKSLASANGSTPAGQPGVSSSAMIAITDGICLFLGVIFILIPAVWVFFYGSRHVKATCEARNPASGWTDMCPLPLLAVSLWLWSAVPMFVLVPVVYHGVAPFFGAFIQGPLGGLFYLFMAAIWAWAGWRLYRLDVRAWWVVLVTLVLFSVSSLLTYAHHDPMEMYRLMGYPEPQIEQIQKTGLLTGHRLTWLTACSMIPFSGDVLFVKKYLRKP